MVKKRKSIIAVAGALVFLVVAAGIVWLGLSRQRDMTQSQAFAKNTQAASPQGVRSIAQPPLADNSTQTKPLSLQPKAVSRESLLNDLLDAAMSRNPELVAAMISRALQSADGVRFMKEFLRDEGLPLEARKHAAETLMRANTEDSVQVVVTTAIQEFQLGRPEVGDTILSSLHIPVGIEGAKGLLKSLLGEDSSAIRSKTLPAEVQSTLRKALRSASDAEEIGRWLAQLYSDMVSSGQAANSNELLGGVAHPAMVGELASQAQVQGKPQEVTNLFDRLIAMEDPGVVGAVARLASKQPSLLNEASEVLFNWSLEHPGQAQPGLFAEYLSNQALPAEQRVVAAYGLAGLIGKADARHALEKSISAETDQNTRHYLHNALANLQNAEQPESLKNSPVK